MIDGIISLILFGVELILLVLICIKNRDHPQFWTIFTIMLLLQLYQLSEFLICTGVSQNIIVRIAISIITFLPPTGFLLTTQILDCRKLFVRLVYYLGILSGAILSFYYLFLDKNIIMKDCNPIYAVYQIGFSFLYGIYYYLIIFLALIVIFYQIIFKGFVKRNSSKKFRGLMLIIGYLSFLLPMAITIIIDSDYIPAITSIMCKYAILLAVTLFIFSGYKDDFNLEKKIEN